MALWRRSRRARTKSSLGLPLGTLIVASRAAFNQEDPGSERNQTIRCALLRDLCALRASALSSSQAIRTEQAFRRGSVREPVALAVRCSAAYVQPSIR
jgi:hypothetical protein